MRDRYDVLVVGAGPAGSAVALLAARRGLAVGLVDKAAFPRDKPCGDGISPGAVDLLDRLGLTSVFDADVPIQDVDIRGADGARLCGRLPTVEGAQVHGYVVPRYEFDERLRVRAVAAGADDLSGREFLTTELHPAHRVVSLRDRHGVHTVHADLLVGADGAYSRVRRALGVPMTGIRASGIAMRAYAKTDLFDVGGGIGPRLMIEFGREMVPGYGWIFPTGRRVVNIGVGVAIRDLRARGLDLRELFDRYLKLNEDRGITLGEHFDRRAHQLPQIGDMPRLAHPRAVLLGDAGSMINPVSGEGIYYGIAAAVRLVEALPDPVGGPGLDSRLRRFEHEFRRTYRWHIASTRVAHLMLRHPRWASVVLTAARRDPVVLRDSLALLFGADRMRLSTTARIVRGNWFRGDRDG